MSYNDLKDSLEDNIDKLQLKCWTENSQIELGLSEYKINSQSFCLTDDGNMCWFKNDVYGSNLYCLNT